ncbi:uncharacterized protein isoform X2 [Choristoneura fumiferana]|uniref:uncharacterized protein isoform X2 n=1 Tax=Choristoneura fumiferana TaxID=7141 RepID=UPI003D15F201
MDESKLKDMNRQFDERLNEIILRKGQNIQFFTDESYEQMIAKVKFLKSKKSHKKPGDYQRLRRFDVMSVGETEKLIVPVKDDVIRCYVRNSEIFQILHDTHLTVGHGGRNRMEKELKMHYKNITREMIVIYLNLCDGCEKKYSVPKKGKERKAQSASDDSESQIPDLPVTVKIEVDEEDISEHEDDIMEKLENKKRMQEEDPIAVDAKKVRVELVPVADTELEPPQYQVIVQPQQSQGQSQSQYVGVLQPPLQQKIAPKATQPQAQQQPDASEPIVIPEFFMNVVVRNQNEILSILKRQVLLQDPDPELLTFLRFLGSKLLRLPKNKRDELQDRITEMLYKE